MTPHEFRVALARLDKSRTAFAEEIGYNPNSISKFSTGSQPIPVLVERYVESLLALASLQLLVERYIAAPLKSPPEEPK